MKTTTPLLPRLARLGALLPALVLATGCTDDLAEPELGERADALTTADVDLPPECVGILTYVNTASQPELYSALPDSVADSLLVRRAITPFVSLADLSTVTGIAQGRLWTLYSRSVTRGHTSSALCVGVYEELGVSASDRDAILTYVNTASQDELATVARTEEHVTAAAIVAARPYTHLQALADTYGVGIATFRSIRNAAIDGSFDYLIRRVNIIERDVRITTNFDWFLVASQRPGQPSHLTCFGVSQAFASNIGATLRPGLADATEVYNEVAGAISYAGRYGELPDRTAGLADLASLTAGQAFFGCYLDYRTSPWSGVQRRFFVNTVTDFRFFTDISWSE